MMDKILNQNGVLIMFNVVDDKGEYYISKDGLSLMIASVFFENNTASIKCYLQNNGDSKAKDISISINMLLKHLIEKGFDDFQIRIEPLLPEETATNLLEGFYYKDKCYTMKKIKNK